MSKASEIFTSNLSTDSKISALREVPDSDGYIRSLLRTYPDTSMPEPGLTLVAKEEDADVYLFRRDGTSEGFLAIPDTHELKGPLDLEELESLDVWEPCDEDQDGILESTLGS